MRNTITLHNGTFYGVTVKREKEQTKMEISWSFVSTFNRFISETSNFFSSKSYK